MRPVVIIFAKAPVPGRVKTRLIPAVDAAGAARLHTAFVRDTLHNLLDFAEVDIELHTDEETDAWTDIAVTRRLQHEGDLGLRMFHALHAALDGGRQIAAVLGSDVPDLPASHLQALLAFHSDIAIGPSEDGGYWGIAARRGAPGMFDGVEWSTGREFRQTVDACRACGLTVQTGPIWTDADTPADLPRLNGSERAPESAAALRQIGIRLE